MNGTRNQNIYVTNKYFNVNRVIMKYDGSLNYGHDRQFSEVH